MSSHRELRGAVSRSWSSRRHASATPRAAPASSRPTFAALSAASAYLRAWKGEAAAGLSFVRDRRAAFFFARGLSAFSYVRKKSTGTPGDAPRGWPSAAPAKPAT